MEGWKTKVGGALLIAGGIGGFGATLLGFPGLSWDVALGMISAGFVAVGLGHKFDKVKQALELIKK